MPLPSELYDREYFLSHYCEGHEEFREGRGLSALKAQQLQILGVEAGMRVLDAGCGRGEVMLACARRGAEVAGIDYSEAAVEISRETLAEFPTADVRRGAVEELPWPDGHFDRILFGDVIEHLDPDQADRALLELKRVLKPDGLLLVHTSPNRLFRMVTWPLARPALRLLGFRRNADALDFWLAEAERYHVNEQTLHSLRGVMRRAGFADAHVWLDANVIRSGGHHLTEGLELSPLARLAARLARLAPVRLLLSNDLYALARKAREVSAVCIACGASPLEPHLHAGDPTERLDLIPTTDRYGRALADIVRCRHCGHMQLERFPDDDALSRAYAAAVSEDYVEEEEGQRATARDTLERIERHVQRGRLLDLGCWVGFLLAEARERGWQVTGVEPSAFAAAYAREHLGLEVHEGDLFDAPMADGGFDAIVLGDVIEHLVHPGEALDRIARLLAPGGVVYLALPDSGSKLARRMGARWWAVLPTHVQYFTRGSLATLLRRHGFEPLYAATAPKTFSVRYYLWRIGGYSRPLSRALIAAARAIGVSERLWAPDFRDRMAVVARGPSSVA